MNEAARKEKERTKNNNVTIKAINLLKHYMLLYKVQAIEDLAYWNYTFNKLLRIPQTKESAASGLKSLYNVIPEYLVEVNNHNQYMVKY